jgi:hypothetical protein
MFGYDYDELNKRLMEKVFCPNATMLITLQKVRPAENTKDASDADRKRGTSAE